jgi:hypothetical protein
VSDVKFSNSVAVGRAVDHVLLRFDLVRPEENETRTEQVTVAIPLTLAFGLGLDLVEAMYESGPEIQKFYTDLAERVKRLGPGERK